MKSAFCQWLTDLSEVADKENVKIEAKYYDGLDYLYKMFLTPEEAYPRYKDLVSRVVAIEGLHPEFKNSIEEKYPLVKEGYDVLECPRCGKNCYPDAKRTDGSIIYNLHQCKIKRFLATPYSFEIDPNGDLVE